MSPVSFQLIAANCVSDGPTVSHAHAPILTPEVEFAWRVQLARPQYANSTEQCTCAR